MALIKGAVPVWGLPLNWVIGEYILAEIYIAAKRAEHEYEFLSTVTFGNLVGSLFFAAIITKCKFCQLFYRSFPIASRPDHNPERLAIVQIAASSQLTPIRASP